MLEGTAGDAGATAAATSLATDGRRPTSCSSAPGSEVPLCLDAAELLAAEGVAARGRVAAVAGSCSPSSPRTTRTTVLPAGVPTLAVEAGVTFGWDRWADDAVGIDRFGASAPGDVVLAKLGHQRRPRRRPGRGAARRELRRRHAMNRRRAA